MRSAKARKGLRNDGGDAAQSWRRARVLEDDADPSYHPRLDRAERRLEHEAAAVRVLVDTGEVVAVDEEAALLEVDSVDLLVRGKRLDHAVARALRGHEEVELVLVAVRGRRAREDGGLLEVPRDGLAVAEAHGARPPRAGRVRELEVDAAHNRRAPVDAGRRRRRRALLHEASVAPQARLAPAGVLPDADAPVADGRRT